MINEVPRFPFAPTGGRVFYRRSGGDLSGEDPGLIREDLLLVFQNRLLVPDYLHLVADYLREATLVPHDPLLVGKYSRLILHCRLRHCLVLFVVEVRFVPRVLTGENLSVRRSTATNRWG
jgi:hypothetical protein